MTLNKIINQSKTQPFKKTNLFLTVFTLLSLLLSCTGSTSSDPTSSPNNQATQYTVTFDSKGGSTVPPQTVTQGSTATPPPIPTLNNRGFAGWHTDSTTTNRFYFTNLITNNITLYAKWGEPITVSFDTKGGSTVPDRVIAKGTTTTELIPVYSGRTFDGWYVYSSTTNRFYFTNLITNTITLHAKWVVTVTFDSNGGSAVQTRTNKPGHLSPNPPTPTQTGATFDKWYIDEEFTSSFQFYTFPITSNITLYAKWNVTVTFDSKRGSSVQAQTNAQGTTTTAPTPTRQDYGFDAWYTDEIFNTQFYFTNIITNHITLYAKWIMKPTTKQALLAFINPAIAADPNTNLNHIDTSLITDMSSLFSGKATFNGDISNWNTSQVTHMNNMFVSAWAFNQDIGNWNTSQVTHMSYMFNNALKFNQPISNWNTSQVTHMNSMFEAAKNFNQPLNNWDTSQVTHMNRMFSSANSFNQPLNNWDTSQVTHMIAMFSYTHVFNQDINNWNTSQVTDMNNMFNGATNFNQPLSNWNTSQVTNMSDMFTTTYSFNQDINSWNVSKVRNMNWMFSETKKFNQPLNRWNPVEVINIANMFFNASSFDQNLESWNVAKATTRSDVFKGSAMESKKPSWCTGSC